MTTTFPEPRFYSIHDARRTERQTEIVDPRGCAETRASVMRLKLPTSMRDLQQLPPIPKLDMSVNAGDYKNIPIQFHHPLYTEDLVDIRDFGIAGESYYFRCDGENAPYRRRLEGSTPEILVRRTVAGKLRDVNRKLAPLGLELFAWDAYRSLKTQVGIWNYFQETKRSESPNWNNEQIYDEVLKYVSDPNRFRADDSSTWPTHMTGASIDLTIRSLDDKRVLDMGSDFDQMNCLSSTTYFEEKKEHDNISDQDQRLINRRLLFYAMASSGFTNYPPEYWHFDWGNQMYRMMRSMLFGYPIEPAFYGVARND